MNIKILQAENSVENVNNSVISTLYNAHINGDISLDVDENNVKIGLVGSITASAGYVILVSTLNSAYPKFHITVNSEYISFEDPNIEAILLANNIGDGTGITVSTAANATFTSHTFLNNTNIVSFPEFSYFTKANTNPPNNLFYGCSNLASIDLSEVTTTSAGEFQKSGITTVNAPNLQNMSSDWYDFKDCTNLTTVQDLGSITKISNGAFNSCYNLLSINIPSTCTYIGDQSFKDCNSLNASIDTLLGQNTTYIGSLAFSNAWNVLGIINFPNIIYLGSNCFENTLIRGIDCIGEITQTPNTFIPGYKDSCKKLQYVHLPYSCTSIGGISFEKQSSLTTVDLYNKLLTDYQEGESPQFTNLSKVTTFGNYCFNLCSALQLTPSDLSGATSIGQSAFRDCKLIAGDLTLSHVISLGAGAFFGCTSITSIDFTGSTFTSAPNEVFSYMNNLSKVIFPTTVTYLGEWIKADRSNLTFTIEGLDNVSSHSQYNWQLLNKIIGNPIKTSLVSEDSIIIASGSNNIAKNTNVHSLYYPLQINTRAGFCNLLNFLWNTEFTYSSLNGTLISIGLLYYKNITSFGEATFKSCNILNLVINNTTPPTLTTNSTNQDYLSWVERAPWDTEIFPTNALNNNSPVIGTLWVPDSAVATYQADPLYSHLNIKGINTKTNGVDYDLPRYATYADWKAAEASAVAQGGHAPQGLIEAWM